MLLARRYRRQESEKLKPFPRNGLIIYQSLLRKVSAITDCVILLMLRASGREGRGSMLKFEKLSVLLQPFIL